MKKFVIALAITATAALAYATPQRGLGHGGNRAAHMQKFAEKLGLTDAQKDQIKSIFKADREKNQQLYSDFRAKRLEYRQLKDANDPKADSVKAELSGMRDQVKAARKSTHESILGVLTPDQRAKLDAWRAEHKQPKQ